jgi:hypothetical protein
VDSDINFPPFSSGFPSLIWLLEDSYFIGELQDCVNSCNVISCLKHYAASLWQIKETMDVLRYMLRS